MGFELQAAGCASMYDNYCAMLPPPTHFRNNSTEKLTERSYYSFNGSLLVL